MAFDREDMTVNGGMQRVALEAIELYNSTLNMLAQVSCPGASNSIILRVENLVSIDDDVVINDDGEIEDLPPNVIVNVYSPPPGAPPTEPPPSPATPSPASPPIPPSLCTDTCIYSSNGACQDGGRYSILPQACAYGTDCEQLVLRSQPRATLANTRLCSNRHRLESPALTRDSLHRRHGLWSSPHAAPVESSFGSVLD